MVFPKRCWVCILLNAAICSRYGSAAGEISAMKLTKEMNECNHNK
jgi:hypothetical protein